MTVATIEVKEEKLWDMYTNLKDLLADLADYVLRTMQAAQEHGGIPVCWFETGDRVTDVAVRVTEVESRSLGL